MTQPGDDERPAAGASGEPPAGGRGRSDDASRQAGVDEDRPFGRPGRPLNRRSPFYMGMTAAAGVALTAAVVQLVILARAVLVLIGLALFVAVGLDPVVEWLCRRRFPRWAAVLALVLAILGLFAGFLSLAIPPLVDQATELANKLPAYLHTIRDHNSFLGHLNDRFHIQQRLQQLLLGGNGLSIAGGVLGAGRLVLDALGSALVVSVLTIYFLLGLPRIKATLYRCVPKSRRPRVVLITEEVFAKVGGYMLGQGLLALIAAIGTLVWLEIFDVPYPLLLSSMVALLDLIPMIGSTIGGIIVSLVALTVSFPVAAATGGFYAAYRLAEDYLLSPRIMGARVEVPAMVAIVAVLVGGSLLGIPGALIGIPLAAAIRLLLQEVAFPRMELT